MKSIEEIRKEEERINKEDLEIKKEAKRIKPEIKKQLISLFEASKGERGYTLSDISKKLGTDKNESTILQNGTAILSLKWRAEILAISDALQELRSEHKIESDPRNTAFGYCLKPEPIIQQPIVQTNNNPPNESSSFFWTLFVVVIIAVFMFFVFK